MLKKVEYTDSTQRQSLIDENSSLILVEDQNITEGNFLIFSDVPVAPQIVYINVSETRLTSIEGVIENGILEGKL